MTKEINKLREIIVGNNEAIELLKEIEEDYDIMATNADEAEAEASSLSEDIEVEREYNAKITEINTGIGIFKVDGSSNLLLQQIAEALEPALKNNPNAVLAALEALR